MMRWALLSVMACVLVACEYKDLCYDHNHWASVRVAYDWQHAPTAQPKGMTVLFYDQTDPSADIVRYDLPGRDGGTARLLPSTWRAVTYNYDTETILYQGTEAIGTLEAFTRASSIEESTRISTRTAMPRAPGTELETVILEPDTLWSAVSDDFSLMLDDERLVAMQPQQRVADVTVSIVNVPNLQYTSQFAGALSGLAPSVYLQTGQVGAGRVTEAFEGQVTGDSTVQMRFRIFGHCPDRASGDVNTHLLTVYAVLADGTKWYHNVDVTSQMHDPVQNPDAHHITIRLDGLPVPKPIVNGSGFQPTVDGWQGEEIDVKM